MPRKKSSLGSVELWVDESSGRVNKAKRGKYLGKFDTGHQIIALYKDGTYEIKDAVEDAKFDGEDLMHISRFTGKEVISALYHEGDKGWTMVKRFEVETSKNNQRFKFITEERGSKLYFATTDVSPKISYSIKAGGKKKEIEFSFEDFIDVKGWKALGNKLTESKILSVKDLTENQAGADKEVEKQLPLALVEEESNIEVKPVAPVKSKKKKSKAATKNSQVKKKKKVAKKAKGKKDKLNPGDTIEMDL